MREYTEKDIQEIREIFDADEAEHGCGYWSLCLDHECFCSMDAPVSQGFNIEVWDRMYGDMKDELSQMQRELEREDMELSCDDDPWDESGDWVDEDEW